MILDRHALHENGIENFGLKYVHLLYSFQTHVAPIAGKQTLHSLTTHQMITDPQISEVFIKWFKEGLSEWGWVSQNSNNSWNISFTTASVVNWAVRQTQFR